MIDPSVSRSGGCGEANTQTPRTRPASTKPSAAGLAQPTLVDSVHTRSPQKTTSNAPSDQPARRTISSEPNGCPPSSSNRGAPLGSGGCPRGRGGELSNGATAFLFVITGRERKWVAPGSTTIGARPPDTPRSGGS